MKARRKIRATLWTLGILALGTYAVRVFVMDYFVIQGNSMQPTLNDGEIVVMWVTSDAPQRGDMVVFKNDEHALVVKRVAGLPKEPVEVRGGDVLIDGQRLPVDTAHKEFIPVFDSACHDVDDHFYFGGTGPNGNPWTHLAGDEWELDARKVPQGHESGLMRMHKGVHNDWITPEGPVHYGPWGMDVGDVVVEMSFNALDVGGRVQLILDEEGDSFRFVLDVSEPGRAKGSILRYYYDEQRVRQKELIDEIVLPFAVGEWTALRFGNIDNHLWVDYGDLPHVLAGDYDLNRSRPSIQTIDPNGPDYEGLLERVKLGGEGCHILVRGIRVLRDLHYGRKSSGGVAGATVLSADEYYVLGDNSPVSRDSREEGPVLDRDIVGRVRWVIWPPSAMRSLD